jgi:excisionase family DNA binding protein
MPLPKLPRMLSIKEVAEVLGVHERTVRARIRSKDIPAAQLKRGGRLLIPEPAIISLCGTARYVR